jgi:aryl-alcohol dehydrogenase-like predicted oxidoreductase
MPAWEFQALNNVAKANGWHQFIAMQNYYNLIYREEEREMMPYCKDAGIGCIPVCSSSPLPSFLVIEQLADVIER